MPTSSVPTTFLLLVEIFVWLLVQYGGSEAAPQHLSEACGVDLGSTTEFALNSTYQINLSRVLSTLSAEADINGGFRINAARGNGDEVYGLSLCRGDVSADVCQECVATASVDIVRNCRRVKSAIIWYDECMLRHSNESFYSTMDTSPSLRMWNTGNVSDAYRFRRLLRDTARDVKSRAKKFATEERNFTAFQTLYALAQCTPDITPADCDKCLSTAIAQLPDYGSQGGRVLTPSCNIRYELYSFYNQAAVNAEAPPPLPPAPVLRRGAPPRSPGSVTPTPREKKTISSTTVIVIVVPIAVCVVLLFIGYGFLRRRAKKKYQAVEEETFRNEITTAESLEFDFGTIEAATDNFSTNNRIGRGGFGTVYKGILSNGQEIGVKRLSRSSGQGAEEFKNEVVLVAKLQHKNLIKLLGFCLKGEEKILIYEFAANKSLDYFLFDPTRQGELDWSKRYKIIGGVSRGMLYLHEDSRLKIIHRDLKASNILLDGDMNPKISDFGLARLLSMNQTEENTNRIVGTYGYMSPEYAMHGHFSVKSDVFSFGVLVMEIVSGKKNRNFYHSDGAEDLISHAWQLWRDGTPIELMDPALGETYTRNEALRCIHVSLLCVQDSEAERPTMATVVHLLNSESPSLPVPKQPAFFVRSSTELNLRAKELELGHCSVNEVSITDLGPR